MMTNLFAYFTDANAPIYFPGAPFLLGSVFMLASAIYAYSALKSEKTSTV
jgi:DHA1 family tetracycline resistance protein-like MFS transporter